MDCRSARAACRLVAVAVVINAGVAGCGSARTTVPGGGFPPTVAGGPEAGSRTCLDPRQPSAAPRGGWVVQSDDSGLTDFELATGTPADVPSAAAHALATRFQHAVGHGFGTPTVTELVDRCVIGRLIQLTTPDQARAVLQVLQLRQQITAYSFPAGIDKRRVLAGGTELLTGDFDNDGSRVSAIVVYPDGLLVRVTVASARSANVQGWPTTFSIPSPGPNTPAPVPLDEVSRIAQGLAAAGP